MAGAECGSFGRQGANIVGLLRVTGIAWRPKWSQSLVFEDYDMCYFLLNEECSWIFGQGCLLYLPFSIRY